MLSFKKSTSNSYGIILNDKNPIFTKTFKIAFGVALSLHFFFILIFHIAPIKIKGSDTLFSPVEVETDWQSDSSIALLVPKESFSSEEYSSLPFLEPHQEEHPKIALPPNTGLSRIENPVENPFAKIESEIITPYFSPLPRLQNPPISIIISGADFLVLKNDPLENRTLSLKNKDISPCKAVFKILIDSSNQKVIWKDLIEKTDLASLNKLADDIINDLQFLQTDTADFKNAIVEVVFNL